MNIPDTLTRLNQALDNLARALATGVPDEVLDAETPLAAAVRELGALPIAEASDYLTLRRALIDVRVTLSRCQALGACSAQLEHAMLAVGYGAHGAPMKPVRPTSSIASRT